MTNESTRTEGEMAGDAMKAATPVEAVEVSREDRARALVADYEHAMHSNSPMSGAMLKELKALLDVE